MCLRLKHINFSSKCFVLLQLALEEAPRQHGFVRKTLRGEHVDVAKLVFALAEVLNLDQALVDERLETVIQPTGTDTQFFSNLALGHVGVVLQHAQDSEVGVFLELGSAAGHVRGFWPRYRHAVSRSASALGAVPLGNVCANSHDFRFHQMSFR